MRIYHFTIFFAIFAVMMLSCAGSVIEERMRSREDIRFLDNSLDEASQNAAKILAGARGGDICSVRDLAVEAFYESLTASLGQTAATPAVNRIRLFVPVILISDGECIYVCYDDLRTGEGGACGFVRCWSEKIDASAQDLSGCLEHYCNLHNEIAKRAGLTYEFNIPDEDGGVFVRGGGTGFYVLFQGYPVDLSERTVYNRFSFAGTGLIETEQFFINLSGEGFASPMYFHEEGCRYRSEESIMFETRKECALNGAFECPECMGRH